MDEKKEYDSLYRLTERADGAEKRLDNVEKRVDVVEDTLKIPHPEKIIETQPIAPEDVPKAKGKGRLFGDPIFIVE